MIEGRTYLLRGVRVKVLTAWRPGSARGVPRNVLIEFEDGSRTIRPFRGLRLP